LYQPLPQGIAVPVIYTVIRENELKKPPDIVITYFGLMIDFINDPKNQNHLTAFVVSSLERLEERVDEIEADRKTHLGKINSFPYLVTKISADFSINNIAVREDQIDLEYTESCYKIARHYGTNMGLHTAAGIYGWILGNMKESVEILSRFYDHVVERGEEPLSKRDYVHFRRHVRGITKKDLQITPQKIDIPGGGKLETPNVNLEFPAVDIIH